LQRQGMGHLALLTPGKNQLQVLIVAHWPMRIKVVPGRFGKAPVIVSDEGRHECAGRGYGRDIAQQQLLDQSVLQRQVGTLDTALGLTAVGADAFNVEFIERPAKLRMTVATGGMLLIDPKNAVPIAIECLRLAMSLQIVTRCLEIAEGRFAVREIEARSTF
jgi:hypothetical protein